MRISCGSKIARNRKYSSCEIGSYMWSWQLAQLSVTARNALPECSTTLSSQTLRLNL